MEPCGIVRLIPYQMLEDKSNIVGYLLELK